MSYLIAFCSVGTVLTCSGFFTLHVSMCGCAQTFMLKKGVHCVVPFTGLLSWRRDNTLRTCWLSSTLFIGLCYLTALRLFKRQK